MQDKKITGTSLTATLAQHPAATTCTWSTSEVDSVVQNIPEGASSSKTSQMKVLMYTFKWLS